VKLYQTILLTLMCVLAGACAPRAPLVPIAPLPARLVPVTDATPSVRAVERQAVRLEAKVSDTAARVAEVEKSIDAAVDSAIRSGDAAHEAEAKAMQSQVRELRVVTQNAIDSAKAIQEDLIETKLALAALTAERDSAVREVEAVRSVVIAERQAYASNLATLTERQQAAQALAAAWRKRSLLTWGIIAAVVLVGVGLKVYRII
jgi:predicted  nucleic acid-binding Zn-ribbon protein